MSSVVDICNRALSRLAANRITSLDDGTIEANECNAAFNQVSQYVQSKGPWQCNKFRVKLPQLAVPPAFGFSYAYALPVDPLFVRVLHLDEDIPGDISYQVENGVLLTDEAQMAILYLGILTNTEQWDSYLEEAVVDQLVSELAYKITGSETFAEKTLQYAKENIKELLALSSLQGSPDTEQSGMFVVVRYGDFPQGPVTPISS